MDYLIGEWSSLVISLLLITFTGGMGGALIGMFAAIADERLPPSVPRSLVAVLIGAAFAGVVCTPFSGLWWGIAFGAVVGTGAAIWMAPGVPKWLEGLMPLRGRRLRLGLILLMVVLTPIIIDELGLRLDQGAVRL
jgi:hypothetical protein